jgi:hypothetical protein
MVIDGPCSGTARYSSACSSVSVSKRTTTPPSPVTTITQTAPTRKTTLSITTTTTYSTTATVTAGSTYVDNIPCGKTLNGPDDNYPYSFVWWVRHSPRQASQLDRQAGTYRLAVMPGVDYVSPDEGIRSYAVLWTATRLHSCHPMWSVTGMTVSRMQMILLLAPAGLAKFRPILVLSNPS